MTHVSRYKHSEEVEKDLVKSFNFVLANITTPYDMRTFLDSVLTETEKTMLSKRLAIFILLEEKFSDTQIAQMLHVTRITVSKMRYFHESHGKELSVVLKKLEKQKTLEAFRKLLASLVT